MKTEIIDLAVNKEFTKFSDEITGVLKQKLAEHPVYKNYTDEVTKLRGFKDSFKKIYTPEEE